MKKLNKKQLKQLRVMFLSAEMLEALENAVRFQEIGGNQKNESWFIAAKMLIKKARGKK